MYIKKTCKHSCYCPFKEKEQFGFVKQLLETLRFSAEYKHRVMTHMLTTCMPKRCVFSPHAGPV